jgi:hypothetical protein
MIGSMMDQLTVVFAEGGADAVAPLRGKTNDQFKDGLRIADIAFSTSMVAA